MLKQLTLWVQAEFDSKAWTALNSQIYTPRSYVVHFSLFPCAYNKYSVPTLEEY